MGTLFEELKRRKVFRVALTYIVAAWLLVQVADTVMPALQMPDWTVAFVTVLFGLGFPIALILAWAYEVTPEGVKPDSASVAPTTPQPGLDRLLLLATFVLVLAVAAYQLFQNLGSSQAPVTPVAINTASTMRTELSLPADLSFYQNGMMDLSPDGSALVFSAEPKGNRPDSDWGLWVRYFDRLQPERLEGTGLVEDSFSARFVTFSPDGQYIGFKRGSSIFAMRFPNGTLQEVVKEASAGPIAWGKNGEIYSFDLDGNLMKVFPGSLTKETVIEATALQDHALYGGVNAVFPEGTGAIIGAPQPDGGRAIANFETGAITEIPDAHPANQSFHFINTGHMLYLNSSLQLVAAGFDFDTLTLKDDRIVLEENIAPLWDAFSLSQNGTLVYAGTDGIDFRERLVELLWVDRRGITSPVDPNWIIPIDRSSEGTGWSLSPDGTQLAFGSRGDIWVKRLPDGPEQRLTIYGGLDSVSEARHPMWTPDGDSIIYSQSFSAAEDFQSIWRTRADGSGDPVQLLSADEGLLQTELSPDSQWLLYRISTFNVDAAGRDIFAINLADDTEPVPLVASEEFAEHAPTISPDGRWLAYSSDRNGRDEIYVRRFPDVDAGRWQVSTDSGIHPEWSSDGSELFYVDADRQMIAASISSADEFEVLERTTLFMLPADTVMRRYDNFYDVSADNQRFLIARYVDSLPEKLNVISNYLDTIRQRLTSGK